MAILDADTRIISHGNITLGKLGRTQALKGHEANVPSPSMEDVCSALRATIGMGLSRNGGAVEIKLKDLSISDCRCYATFLFNVVNKRGASAVVRDTHDDSTEELPLERPSQGYEASCHFVLALTPNAQTGQYPFAFEMVPKISLNRIITLFNKTLQRASDLNPNVYFVDRNYEIANEQTPANQIMKFRSTFDISMTPDEGFMDELRDGVISNVKLIKHERSVFNFADRSGVIHAKKHSIELEASRDNSDCIDWLKKVAASELGDNFDQISFTFKQETGQRTATLELANIRMDGLERMLVRKSMLEGFEHPLKDSYDSSHQPIERKIIEVM